MITLYVADSVFEACSRGVWRSESLPWQGLTVRELVEHARAARASWARTPLAAVIDGRRLEAAELEEVVNDDVAVLVLPDVQGVDPLTIGIALLVSFAVSWAYSKLVGQPKGLVPSERGETRSATYQWDGMATEYRQGYPIPWILGRHMVPGQVIYADVFASAGGINIGPSEFLRIILALGEGRIRAIGGVTAGPTGEDDGIYGKGRGGFVGQTDPSGGVLPAGIEVNGNQLDSSLPLPGARAWLRMGEIQQRPLPTNPFRGVTTLGAVDQDLDEAGQVGIGTIPDVADITTIAGILTFRSGLYSQDSQGNLSAASVSYVIEWRRQGETLWRSGRLFTVAPSTPFLSAFSVTWSFDPQPGSNVAGPLEVRVTRSTPSGGSVSSVSTSSWRQLIWNLNVELAYPGVALLGLELQATEKISGGRPNFRVPVDGILVRVWDAAINGGNPSARAYWDVPASGDPYFGVWTYPPGRNPSWLAVEMMTNTKALGRVISDAEIDWPAFAAWAAYCDGGVVTGGGTEARFQCGLVIDDPASALDKLLQIFQAGRAMIVMRGSVVSVKYEYAAAHSRGSTSVAAKVRAQLFLTNNVRNLQTTRLNTLARPARIELQILNEAKGYRQDTVPVVDPSGGFDDVSVLNPVPYTSRAVQLYGVTRRSQAYREGLFMHAVNRVSVEEIEFDVATEALGADVGQVVGIQHDILMPFATDAFAFRLGAAVTASSTITLSHPVTLAALATYAIVVRETSGAITETLVTSVAGTYAAGTPITIAATITAPKSAPVAFGRQSAVVKDYQILALTLNEDTTRHVRAVIFDASVHTDPDVGGTLTDEAPGDQPVQTSVVALEQRLATSVPTTEIRAVPTQRAGRFLVQWSKPSGQEATQFRVWAKIAGASSWWAIGDTKASELEWTFAPGVTYTVAVATQNRAGAWQLPDEAAALTFTAEEWAPVRVPSIVRGTFQKIAKGVRLSWQPIDSPHFDAYEVRGGTRFFGAQVIGTTRTPQLDVIGSGRSGNFLVVARSRAGLYSERALAIAAGDGIPANAIDIAGVGVALGPFTPLDLAARATTTSGPTLGSGTITLPTTAVENQATVTTNANIFELGFLADALLVVTFETYAIDSTTVDDAAFSVDSGEARWRTVDGRESSPARPGVQITETVDDFAMPIDDVPPARRVGTYDGQAGAAAAVICEVRFDLDGDGVVEGPWELYRPGVRSFRDFDLRFTLVRESAAVAVYVENVSVQVFV